MSDLKSLDLPSNLSFAQFFLEQNKNLEKDNSLRFCEIKFFEKNYDYLTKCTIYYV